MRRGLVHAMAWTLATGAAVTLSWWGVYTVMSGTAYDPPLAVPLGTEPLVSSTQSARPAQSPSPSPPLSPSPSEPASPQPSASPPAGPSSAEPSPGASAPKPPGGSRTYRQDADDVRAYPVSGGRVVFSLGASSAELVSATPAAGWRMQVWKVDFWIRVTFTRDGREVSVFCTWHDGPPRVEVVDP
ncbi:hypothetical protein ACFWUQ_09390 [Streptomyces sp. NPDC058662]|uniref:hypothetical protein n=1 Tax=Streptomyces sp. NPDC058662 TaxID=3346583 RepID=UPI0036610355